LLSAFCFMKSSARLHDWLIGHKILGRYIYNYITYHAIPKKTKVISILLLWLSLTISILLVQKTLVTIILIIIGLAVSVHLLTLKSLESRELSQLPRDQYPENSNGE
jgi:hypothetical protein